MGMSAESLTARSITLLFKMEIFLDGTVKYPYLDIKRFPKL
jgi:hypothetical protein